MNRSRQQWSLRRYIPFVLLLCIFAVAGISAEVALAEANVNAISQAKWSSEHDVGGTPTSTPTSCANSWTVVSGPNYQDTVDNYLQGVSAISANDAWAVGYYNGGYNQTLAGHWDGSVWSAVSSPNPSNFDDQLYSVDALSSSDVWAVGYYSNETGVHQTLTEHWNGSMWSVVASPNLGSGRNDLYGVSSASPIDVWAVGEIYDPNTSTYQTLAEHWDGSSWSIVATPNPGPYLNTLNGVAAIASNDVWAIGYATNDVAQTQLTLAEHWDGTSWSVVTTPNPGPSQDALMGISAVSSDDIWAVGSYVEAGIFKTLVEYWNGSSWSIVATPNHGSHHNYMSGVAAISTSDVWAVGYYFDDTGNYDTLTEQWNGTSWLVVSSPNYPSPLGNSLVGVSAVSSGDVWTVGTYFDTNFRYESLVEHYANCDIASTATPSSPTNTPVVTQSPSYTSTPSRTATAIPSPVTATSTFTQLPATTTRTSTATPTATTVSAATNTVEPTFTVAPTQPSTATATVPATIAATTTSVATATACSIQFSDVPSGSTFYAYVRCLACLGLINGYPNGTFKPNNDVTRGQLSKIVSNAAGFSDPQPTQMFQDVPLSSTFQLYIGRLASRGYINGYPCGQPGEQCVPPNNLPYFRPNANATRGQISKIVSNAAGFEDTPTGQQFQDVPVGSTYYTYTYRLVSRGVMSGYPCGTPPAGVCVPPANLPYFRPNNNATRGQTSKIVANTFFPDCNISNK